MLDKNAKIYVAGHRGLVGSAIWKNLEEKGYTNLIGKTHTELDLLDGVAVRRFFDEEQPEYVFLAAAFVGGIMANSIYRADFIYKNLQIQQNVIGESFRHGVKKLLFLGSTCIYPRDAEQPMKEDALLTSPLEYTNEPYAIAKIAGLKMCESFNLQYGTNYIAVMPTNLYGPNDNFDLERRTPRHEPASGRRHQRRQQQRGHSEYPPEIRHQRRRSEIMGYRHPLARIPLERGDGRCQRLRHGTRRLQRYLQAGRQGNPQLPHQYRYGQGNHYPPVGRTDCQHRRLSRPADLRHFQTRRHHAQTDRSR